MAQAIDQRIAEELSVGSHQVRSAVALLDDGSTVPFIARYRKEATGGLSDEQLRSLEERLGYLRELEARRKAVLESIAEQGKLTDALAAQIDAADTKARLEDLYAPFKVKRRTKAQIAREAGLEPLADLLLSDPSQDPETAAAAFLNPEAEMNDAAAALAGARAILTERFSEDADLIGDLRERMWKRDRSSPSVRAGAEEKGAKFSDYFDFAETFTTLPSHRVLALMRGEKEEALSLALEPGESEVDGADCEAVIAAKFGIRNEGRPADAWLAKTVSWAWRTRILVKLGVDLRMRLWQLAEDEAVRVFAANLKDLLLAAPAGPKTVMGLDPGFRTGVKVAVVDATGKVLDATAIYPHQPQNQWDASLATLGALVKKHDVQLIAIGNGTASRETDRLAADLIKAFTGSAELAKIVVSEAGASIYSASAYATKELPGMDVSLRGAVSIARRLQDPLAELVKIEPKHIGVGQYQHDLTESKLTKSLEAVVEDARERRRRGPEHRFGAAAVAGVGVERERGREHRGAPRRARPLRRPQGPAEGASPGPQGFRAGRRVPPGRGRGQPARRLRRPPRGLPGGRADPARPRERRSAGSWATRRRSAGSSPATSPTTASACPPSRTSSPSWRSPAATRGRSSRPPPSRKAWRRSRTSSPECSWKGR